MIQIRHVEDKDFDFWFAFDKHLSKIEFKKKVRDKMGYLILKDNIPIGILRYNLFWDNIPFCTMLFIDYNYQKNGYGKLLINYWENDMKNLGYGMIMTSTQVDEYAQHFYRNIGFKEAGCLLLDILNYQQPMEMFFTKAI